MFNNPIQTPPHWWQPKLSPFWVKALKPFREKRQRRVLGLREVDIGGADGVRQLLANGHAVLITPNHPGRPDPFVMMAASDAVGLPFHFMVAWQVFFRGKWLLPWMLQKHGCFSVDREGADLRAFKCAVKILEEGKSPLVIFPEGEVYHTCDRITPFREGTAAIAMTAAKRREQPVSIVPTALKYHFLEDPTDGLHDAMDELESVIFWRPRRDLPLHERIYRFAEAALAIKELEHNGATSAGPLPARVAALRETILARLESKYEIDADQQSVPERIKTVRQRAITKIEAEETTANEREQCQLDLDDVFLVVQLYSYPGDYVAESHSLERIAETILKFEEDVLGKWDSPPRAAKRATVVFGEPINVGQFAEEKGRKQAGPLLTRLIEDRVQSLIDSVEPPAASRKS